MWQLFECNGFFILLAEKGEGGVVAEWRRREDPVAGHSGLVEARMTIPSFFSFCSLSSVPPFFSSCSLFSKVSCVSLVFHVLSRGPSVCLMCVSVSVVRAVRAVLSRAVCCAVFLCAVRCVLCRLRVMCCMRCDAALLTLMFCCSCCPSLKTLFSTMMSHYLEEEQGDWGGGRGWEPGREMGRGRGGRDREGGRVSETDSSGKRAPHLYHSPTSRGILQIMSFENGYFSVCLAFRKPKIGEFCRSLV